MQKSKRRTRLVFGVSLPPDLIAQVDEARGDINRSKYIQRLLERALAEKKQEAK